MILFPGCRCCGGGGSCSVYDGPFCDLGAVSVSDRMNLVNIYAFQLDGPLAPDQCPATVPPLGVSGEATAPFAMAPFYHQFENGTIPEVSGKSSGFRYLTPAGQLDSADGLAVCPDTVGEEFGNPTIYFRSRTASQPPTQCMAEKTYNAQFTCGWQAARAISYYIQYDATNWDKSSAEKMSQLKDLLDGNRVDVLIQAVVWAEVEPIDQTACVDWFPVRVYEATYKAMGQFYLDCTPANPLP